MLSQFANQMKSKGLLILISIRFVIGWIAVIATLLNLGKPPFYIALLVSVYFLSTSFFGKRIIQKEYPNKHSNPTIMFFLVVDYFVLLFAFYLTIIAHPIGLKSLPIQNSIFFSLFFYSNFTFLFFYTEHFLP
ncbi:hypothetical protein [Leptospira bouyouniensis]|uniref:hypothetical protein n=1 Tax=Leptospira bouyouniensis TaxID=2484911 RepID=UPI001FC93BD0|nr:hypothetical protein [Leptospira bouyouniensis]